jgi:hypothetical protein
VWTLNFLRTLQLVGIAAALCLLTAGPAFAQSLTISLTEPGGSTFYPGEPVPIEGTLAYGSVGIGGAVVTVEILNPSAALFRHGTATTDSDGDFAFTVDMPFNAPLGTYTVNAYYAGLKATSTFALSASALSVSPTSWTIGQYGYVEQGDSVPDQVFELTNSAGSPHSATVTFPSFISFGSNPSGFSVNVLAGDTVLLVADDVDTGSVGDFYGEIVIDSATNGVIHIPVSMKVRSSLAPVVEVDPGSWVEETTRNAYTVESFNVANTGTEGVDVSVSESIPRITILDSWASSFYLPPDSSMTFRAQAETSEKVTISGNILVQPSGLSTIYIPVSVTITNDPPTVSITSPSDGSTVSGTTTISLTGSDPDDDPLTFSITLVDLTDPSNRSSFSGSSYAWNTQQSPEGPYRILGRRHGHGHALSPDGNRGLVHQGHVRHGTRHLHGHHHDQRLLGWHHRPVLCPSPRPQRGLLRDLHFQLRRPQHPTGGGHAGDLPLSRPFIHRDRIRWGW